VWSSSRFWSSRISSKAERRAAAALAYQARSLKVQDTRRIQARTKVFREN
jgi:hypothetical protein